MSIESEIVVKEIKDAGIIILNRPKFLNAITPAIGSELLRTLKMFESKKSLVIIKGTGRALSSGRDIITLQKFGQSTNQSDLYDFCLTLNEVIYLLNTYRIPVVILVNGIAFGCGGSITALSKYSIVTEKAVFSMPETKFGFHPNLGASYFFNRSKEKLGYYMGLTGASLKGTDIVTAGFASHFCYSNNLEKLEELIINCSNKNDIDMVIDKYCEKTLPALSLAGAVLDCINKYFGEPTVENILSKLKQDKSNWAKSTVTTMKKYSPTSLKVILKQLHISQNMDLMECLAMEVNLSCNFYNFKDVYEGTKALLLDKTYEPKWSPSRLSDVSERQIQEHFKVSAGDLLKKVLLDRHRDQVINIINKL